MIPYAINPLGVRHTRAYRQYTGSERINWSDYLAVLQTLGEVDFDFYLDYKNSTGNIGDSFIFLVASSNGAIGQAQGFVTIRAYSSTDEATYIRYFYSGFFIKDNTEYNLHYQRRGDTYTIWNGETKLVTRTLAGGSVKPEVGVAPVLRGFHGEIHRIELFADGVSVWRAGDEYIYA